MPNPAAKPALRIAIAGLGTVGAGVIRLLDTNRDLIAARAGRAIEVIAVSARDRNKDRGVDHHRFHWEDDMTHLAAREDVDVVLELVGGSDGAALALSRATLAAGKGLVTANKAMIAHHGLALAQQAEAQDAPLKFEAAVAGGIPVVKGLREGTSANALTKVYGIPISRSLPLRLRNRHSMRTLTSRRSYSQQDKPSLQRQLLMTHSGA